jgi:hypothetical protein
VKQKTAVPQGAASLSLAVLESDGRKREGAIDSAWGGERGGKTIPAVSGLSQRDGSKDAER